MKLESWMLKGMLHAGSSRRIPWKKTANWGGAATGAVLLVLAGAAAYWAGSLAF